MNIEKRQNRAPGRIVMRRKATQAGFFALFRAAALVNALALFIVVFFLVINGWKAINWTFLTQAPTDSMTKGGIFPAIVGTIYLSAGAMAVAFPLGLASAVYLSEYASQGMFMRAIRFGINNLAGVPSIVFGLFGLAFFVTWMDLEVSILSGSLTLGILSLPVVIGTSEEALRAVPDTYREASLGLGATKWQTISRVVMPAALPSMITGGILALSRAAGETAAIMFTAAVYYTTQMPSSLLDPVMALPYHIYVLATAGTNIEQTRPLQYGTALVLIGLVLGMNLAAIIYRARLRKRK
ncbi:MAG: phosphate ABC transporter permease PstA [Desulfosalsimonadaceae bacterium]